MSEAVKNANGGKPVRWVILAVVAIALLIWFGNWVVYRMTHAVTNNAFVESDLVTVSPLVAGHVAEVRVEEGAKVHKGDLLAVLDDRDYQAEVDVRKAQVAYAEQALQRARITAERVAGEVEQGIGAARQDVEQARMAVDSAGNALDVTKVQVSQSLQAARGGLSAARAELEAVKKDYERLETLFKRGSLEKRRFDQITAQLEGSRARVTAMEADVAKAEAASRQVAISENQLRQSKAMEAKSRNGLALAEVRRKSVEEAANAVKELSAQVEQAKKALAAAELKLEHTRIRAPFEGVVAKKFVNAGDFVSPGFPAFSVYDRNNIYVTANMEESRFRKVKMGQSVDIEVDAFPSEEVKGTIVEIGEATGSKFALIPRDNSAGEFTKVVQRIPVKVKLTNYRGNWLLPGMSVYVGVQTGW